MVDLCPFRRRRNTRDVNWSFTVTGIFVFAQWQISEEIPAGPRYLFAKVYLGEFPDSARRHADGSFRLSRRINEINEIYLRSRSRVDKNKPGQDNNSNGRNARLSAAAGRIGITKVKHVAGLEKSRYESSFCFFFVLCKRGLDGRENQPAPTIGVGNRKQSITA